MGGLWERAIGKFNDRTARIGVLGLGYAGLPLTCGFAEAGFEPTVLTSTGRRSSTCRRGAVISATFPPTESPAWSKKGGWGRVRNFRC